MPVTRSQGRAPEAWTVEVSRGRGVSAICHEQPPRSPSTTEGTEQLQQPLVSREGEDLPIRARSEETGQQSTSTRKGGSDETLQPLDRTLKPADRTEKTIEGTYRRTLPMTTRGDARTEHSRPPSTTNRTTRSNKKISRAREDLLKIKLELAQLALQRAEEEDSDGYMDDRDSNDEYVRSWLEEAPKPEPEKRANAAEGDIRDIGHEAPPPPVDFETIVDLDKQVPLPNPIVNEVTNRIPPRGIEVKGEDSLRPFITELTSAIASLADRKTEQWTPNHPSASKVIMTLPNFNGAHTEWLSFRAIYETTRRYFNDVENTARLRRSLRGRALETVSSELIGHAQPDDIMRELELQFGRPDSIAQAETDRLRGLPRCGEAPKDICNFASRVRSGVVTLRALKKDHYLINAELMRLLTEKLPNSLRVQWYRTYTEKYQSLPDLTLFSEFITEQARFCSAFAPPENISSIDATTSKRVTQRTHTAVDKSAKKCRICDKEGHNTPDCKRFKDGSSDKRWELAKKHSLCFRCLRSRRPDHKCKPKKCGVKGCIATHHQLLHYTKKAEAQQEKPATQEQSKETVASSRATSSHAYLKMVPVRVIGPAGEVSTFALLDDGSTVSLIDEDLAKQVGAEGQIDPLKIGAIGDTTIDTPCSRRITVSLASQLKNRVPFRARTIPKLNLAPQTVSEEDVAHCKHLDDLRQQLVYNTGAPKILIGQDNWHLLLASEIRRGPKNQPIASLTTLGWTLHGAHTRIRGQQVHYCNRLTAGNEDIDKQLRIVTSDPEENTEMPDSYGTALERLVSIERRLDSNHAIRDINTEHIDPIMQKGIEKTELTLQRTEEKDSCGEFMDNRKLNNKYARCWLEEAFEPEPVQRDNAAEGDNSNRIVTTPPSVDFETIVDLQTQVPLSNPIANEVHNNKIPTGGIEAEFLHEAEKLLVQIVQQQSFEQEIARLREQKTLDENSRLRPLQIEDIVDVIRLRSRIAATERIADHVKRPPILHGDHHINQLYLDWTHRGLQHSGTDLTINEVRQHYWVVKMRPTAKKVLSRRPQCRIRKAQTTVPATGDHPRTRLTHHQRPFTFTGRDVDSKRLWRRSQILADMFWRRWVREYLPELQNRREPHTRGPDLLVGDPILIADGQLPRNTWPRGRIVALFPGADGEARTAEVRTAGGTLKRPVKKLVPLPK